MKVYSDSDRASLNELMAQNIHSAPSAAETIIKKLLSFEWREPPSPWFDDEDVALHQDVMLFILRHYDSQIQEGIKSGIYIKPISAAKLEEHIDLYMTSILPNTPKQKSIFSSFLPSTNPAITRFSRLFIGAFGLVKAPEQILKMNDRATGSASLDAQVRDENAPTGASPIGAGLEGLALTGLVFAGMAVFRGVQSLVRRAPPAQNNAEAAPPARATEGLPQQGQRKLKTINKVVDYISVAVTNNEKMKGMDIAASQLMAIGQYIKNKVNPNALNGTSLQR